MAASFLPVREQLLVSLHLWRIRVAGACRAGRDIIVSEPMWVAAVLTLTLGGLAVGLPRALRLSSPLAAATFLILLTALLESRRRDGRLATLLGAHFSVVRLVDAFLWLLPLIALMAVIEPIGALTGVLGMAAVAILPVRHHTRRARTHAAHSRLAPYGAVAWMAGVRRAAWLFAACVTAGTIAPAHPLLTAVCMIVATLVATSFHWAPAEGWLLVHAAKRSSGRFLWGTIGVSTALLSFVLAPIVLVALLRLPSETMVVLVLTVMCVHAHVCGILCRYVEYQEGLPLSTAGSLSWMLVSALVLFPPVAFVVVLFLHRRAVARLAPYCTQVHA